MGKTRYPISSRDKFELKGHDDLVRTLAGLERSLRKEAMVDALEAGAQPIFLDVKTTTAFIDRSGKLRDSIEIKRRKASVAIRSGGPAAPHAILIEYGHGTTRKGRREHARGGAKQKRGARRGTGAPPHPFMRPAVDRNADRAMKIILDQLAKSVTRIVNSSGRRAA